ncbi:hypothetical protein [Streptomyces sp. NPDC003635]
MVRAPSRRRSGEGLREPRPDCWCTPTGRCRGCLVDCLAFAVWEDGHLIRSLGEDALRALCGFVQEGRPDPNDIDAATIRLHGFRVRKPQGPDPAKQEALLRRATESMGPPRFSTTGPDGSLTALDGP